MSKKRKTGVRRWLKKSHPAALTLYAGVWAFFTYCCMYAMRKPFTSAAYDGQDWWSIHFKIVLVSAQVLGYAVSKFVGIRLISGMRPRHRAAWMLGLLGWALAALAGFALTPRPWSAVWLFVNGLPLGMLWGLVFGYLEGRRTTEVLAAILSVNFIVSSGFVKSVGQWLLHTHGVAERWMPLVAGSLFVPLLLLSVWMLEQLPPPSKADRVARTVRPPMSAADRRRMWRTYAPGLLVLVVVYLTLTVLRDVRDNFAVEIWAELGYAGQAGILTTAELPIALVTLLVVGSLMLVRDNFSAFRLQHALILGAAALLAASTLLFENQQLSPLLWMSVSGFALFLPYILFNGALFDRLLAAFRERGNVGFLMYVADAVGYLGSVVVLLWRNFGFGAVNWLSFYTRLCYLSAGLVAVFTLLSWWYFRLKMARREVAGLETNELNELEPVL